MDSTEFELRHQLTRLTLDLEVLRSEMYGQLEGNQRELVARMHESTSEVRRLFNHWITQQSPAGYGEAAAD